ncbi:MAG: gamma-glutamylcyclotransferase [Acidobacteriota bacterium]|nr:gamma-glutamylcyclotransferase [Acidobacteriota bacterium]
MITEYLFLYGTLLADGPPDEVAGALKTLRRIGPAHVRGRLYDLGEYPGAILAPSSTTLIQGEIFELPATPFILKALDDYEEFDPANKEESLFIRTKARATLLDGPQMDCWMYVYNDDPGTAPLLADGNYSKTKAA